MKTKSALIIGLLLVALTGLLIERLSLYQDGYDIGYGDGLLVLPSVADIQRRVGAKPDGIIGIETITKWDKASCQQSASKWDYLYKEKEK